ncbi:response regulator [Shewanella benthica]|uniref:Response regulatory domain-containing protein n=1 Tax=Shewanella benthica KT99 TaxID=314608 RepID=A9CZ04_9GAMM|nr:response regulator [Shewanella benthica]EDQ02224.1 hypothetical protein KT99_12679 [Shewanella benthica KT99]
MRIQADMPQYISLDSTKFFQLTTNFINNAFKYSSGKEVVFDAFKTSTPQIVVMDYRLAKTDGISLIGEMRRLQTENVHYFILSANDKSEIARLRYAGLVLRASY